MTNNHNRGVFDKKGIPGERDRGFFAIIVSQVVLSYQTPMEKVTPNSLTTTEEGNE